MFCRICGTAIHGESVQSHSLTRRRPGGPVQPQEYHVTCLKLMQRVALKRVRDRRQLVAQ